MKLKKGDTVHVITGKDAGVNGKIARVYPDRNKIIVEGVATARRSQRPTGQTMQGGIIDKDMPIPIANVALICPTCDAATRVGYRFEDDGTKVRICKKCGGDI